MRRLLGLALIALPLAACGSSSPGSGSTPTAKQDAMIGFAKCMRANGVPNFPDLSGHGIQVQPSPGGTFVNGVAVNGPAFQSAMKTCHSKLPNGGQAAPPSAARRNAMLRFAQCMRSHGVPGFPDPTFNGNRVQIRIQPGAGIDPNSPNFKHAQAACGPLAQNSAPDVARGG